MPGLKKLSSRLRLSSSTATDKLADIKAQLDVGKWAAASVEDPCGIIHEDAEDTSDALLRLRNVTPTSHAQDASARSSGEISSSRSNESNSSLAESRAHSRPRIVDVKALHSRPQIVDIKASAGSIPKRKPLLTRLKEKSRNKSDHAQPVDNFTIWDRSQSDPLMDMLSQPAGMPSDMRWRPRASSADHTSALVTKFGLRVQPRRADSSSSSDTHSAEREISVSNAQAQQPVTIGSIDWSQLDDTQARLICSQFANRITTRHDGADIVVTMVTTEDLSEPSPTDSAKSFGHHLPPYQGKGKGRAREADTVDAWFDLERLHPPPDSAAAADVLRKWSPVHPDINHNQCVASEPSQVRNERHDEGGLYDIVKQEAQLREEMDRQQDTWQKRLQLLERRKEAQLLELQQRRAAEHQQIEDSMRLALELLREEEQQCLEREEEERIQAAELQARIEEEERLAAALAAMRDCVVCGDSKHPLDFAITTPTAKCQHAVQTCLECVTTWINSEFVSKGSADLKCPECPEILAHADVQRGASADTFLAYEKIITRNVLAQLPNFAWCLAPGCEAGQLNEDNGEFMECAACKYQQCVRHRCAWHKGETCRQYDYRTSGAQARDEERATERMLDSISKKCPGAQCGWRIQKTDGCDHMTCRKCRHQFCWQCLASHAEIRKLGNTAHQRSCKFHSDNLTASWPFNVH